MREIEGPAGERRSHERYLSVQTWKWRADRHTAHPWHADLQARLQFFFFRDNDRA